MYLTFVRHRIKDYDKWKKAFDNNGDLLFEKYGCLSTHIVKVNDDPTDIAVVNTWKSKKHWDDFGAAHELPEYKDTLMKKEDGGVVGDVEFCGGEVVE